MTLMQPVTSATEQPSDESWVADLTDPGPSGLAAQRTLHDLLLRAARLQVWRLRHQLPGAGSVDLEDLAQQAADDALMAVLSKLDTFEGRSRFTTWVYKFGILHAGVAVRRQAWRHREVPLFDSIHSPDPGSTPEAYAESSDLLRAVEAAITHDLTSHQRRVALALLVDHVPIDVLAERLSTSRNALYKTLHDARQRLRASLCASGHLDQAPHRSTP